MTTPLPPDRLSIRRRATFLVLLGAFGLVSGVGILARAGDALNEGWLGALPDPLLQVAAVLLLLFGLGFALPSLLWMVIPLRGPRPPAVPFEPTRIVIRGPLFPKSVVVERDAVVGVHVAHVHPWGQSFGLRPAVIIRTNDGRGRGIQNIYGGDPDVLARDIAEWAAVPLGGPRRILVVDEEFRGWRS